VIADTSPRERAIAKAWAIREHYEAPERAAALQDEKQRNDFTRHALTADPEVFGAATSRQLLEVVQTHPAR
jgi:hypothetical protein